MLGMKVVSNGTGSPPVFGLKKMWKQITKTTSFRADFMEIQKARQHRNEC